MTHHRIPRRLAALASLALLGAGCASDGGAGSGDVNWLVQHRRFEEAVRIAAKRHADRPNDKVAEEQWRLASAAYLIEQGRRATFEDKDLDALAKFEEALEVAPDLEQAHAWREATLDKLATYWVLTAIEWHASDNLPEAERCYEKALEYRPDDVRAKSGLARVLFQLNYRVGKGNQYYEEGIQALEQHWLDQAARDFSATHKYDEHNERARDRRKSTDTMRAQERVLIAEEYEAQGLYSAARNEFRLATLLDPAHEAALAGLDRNKREEQAAEILREADRKILKRDFGAAESLLAKGEALTERQRDAFASERDRLQEEQLRARYESARALEADHRYDEAIAAYTALLELSQQQGFQDSFARRDTLVDLLERAERYYVQAQATTDPAEQRALLQQLMVVHGDYKDVREWLKRLEAAEAAPQDQPAPETPPGEEPAPEQPPR
jgi:tetratricopeptide (TPR) repeat protein